MADATTGGSTAIGEDGCGVTLLGGEGRRELSDGERTSTAISFSDPDIERSPIQIRAIGTKMSKCRISDPTTAFDHNRGESVCCHRRIEEEGDGDSDDDGDEEGITSPIKSLSLED